jgi:hypothetical protein
MKIQDNRRYPIGQFEYGKTYSLDETRKNIKAIARLPKDLKKALSKLRRNDADTPYRRGGWTVRQVVHHLADSHMNAYIRMKLAVTENAPVIKTYEEGDWAKTEDGKEAPLKISVKLLAALHRRWVLFLESLTQDHLERGYFHPTSKRLVLLPEAIALYAWHSRHHLAHVMLVVDGHAKQEESDETPAPAKTKGRPKKVAETEAAPKRARRSAAEVAAEKAAKAAAPKMSRAEVLAKARAARTAKAATESKKAEPKPKKAPAAPKKPAADPNAPKMTRAEILAKARATAAANRAAKAATEPKKAAAAPKRARRSAAEVAAEKAAKAAAPKMSRAEALAKARAARAANAPAKPKKPAADPNAPKMTRAEALAKARAAKKAK